MKTILFLILSVGILTALASTIRSIVRPDRWPWAPPEGSSRWMRARGVFVTLLSTVGVLALGVLDWNSFVFDHWARFLVGGLLMLPGGAFAHWGSVTLGFAESRSFSPELVRRGPYRYSRNPQYVGAPPAYFGWAIACNSQLVLIVAALGSVALLLQPFVEEPWLRKRFGAQYDAYAREVPRFLPHATGGSGRDGRV